MGNSQGHAAAQRGDVTALMDLLRSGYDVHTKGESTPLHEAARKGRGDCTHVLLQHDADVNARNDLSPLHLAARQGHFEVVEKLLAANAHVNTKDSEGWTPLHEAARVGHDDCVATLLEHGADVHAATNAGTALHEASYLGHTHLVKKLILAGASVLVVNGDDDAVESSANDRAQYGQTPYDLAVLENCTSAAAILQAQRAVEESKRLRAALAAADEGTFKDSDSENEAEIDAGLGNHTLLDHHAHHAHGEGAGGDRRGGSEMDDVRFQDREDHGVHLSELEAQVEDRYAFLAGKLMEVMKSLKVCTLRASEAERAAEASKQHAAQLGEQVDKLTTQLRSASSEMNSMSDKIKSMEATIERQDHVRRGGGGGGGATPKQLLIQLRTQLVHQTATTTSSSSSVSAGDAPADGGSTVLSSIEKIAQNVERRR